MQEEKEGLPDNSNLTKRHVSSEGEKVLYHEYSIGNHGKLTLVDYMGGDPTVERAATLGHGRAIFPEKPEQQDFINHLFAKGIYDPFKSVQLKFLITSPIATALHIVYEKTASVNEYSGRYSEMLDTSYTPSLKALVQRLGTLDASERAKKITEIFVEGRKQSYEHYRGLVEIGMARELARMGLGTDNDTRYVWKIDLFSLANFVKRNQKLLGYDDPALDYIEQIAALASHVAPDSWRALILEPMNPLRLTSPSDDKIVDPSLSPASWQPQKTRRAIAPGLEGILFQVKTFLDYGEFQVIDYMGDENAPAEAARTSYGSGTKKLQDNKNLIRSLIRDFHTSPIEMTELSFEAKSPVFTDPRQAGRHRMLDDHGFMGYTVIGNQFYFPPETEFRYQDKLNRQGRGKEMDLEEKEQAADHLRETLEAEQLRAKKLRNLGAPEDLVRMSKGVGFYTKRWRTGDSHNLNHFLRLRLDAHAQKEVRDLAQCIDEAHAAHVPAINEALKMYIINSVMLSEKEIPLLRRMLRSNPDLKDLNFYKGTGFLILLDKEDPGKGYQLSREGLSFKAKLKKILGE